MVTFRLKLISVMLLLFILSVSMMNSAPAAGVREPLSLAMEATGAKVEEFSVNAWVKLENGGLTNNQLESMVQDVMSQLGISAEEYQLVHQQKNKYKTVQAEVINKKFHALVSAQVVPEEMNTAQSEGYLIVNIEARSQEDSSVRYMQEKIADITHHFGPSPHISTCLIGWLDGKLRAGEWHKALNDAFIAVDAVIIDKLEAEHFVSYTGFTSEITDWLQVDGKRINLNIAMRYSPYDQRTYITIGSPIITREY